MATAPAAPAAGGKGSNEPIFQQLSLASLRTRLQDLHNTIGRIVHTFHTNPSSNWAEALAQFSIVNVELLSLVEDIKPVLKAFVVYPKNVTAATAPILPIMLSSKLLPELEAEEAALKEQVLNPLSNLTHHAQTEKLQKQIEILRSACDFAERALAEDRKALGFFGRQGVPSVTTVDKVHAARIHEQEKLLHAAANFGDGLRIPPDQRGAPAALPPHIAAALACGDQASSFSRAPQTTAIRPSTPQQQQQQTGTTPQSFYVSSPRPSNFNEIQQQPQQQAVVMQQQQRGIAKPHLQQKFQYSSRPQLPVQQALLQPQQLQQKMQQFPQQSQIQQQLQQQQSAQLQQHLHLQHLHSNQLQQQQGNQLRSQMGNQLGNQMGMSNFGNQPIPFTSNMVPPNANIQQRLQTPMSHFNVGMNQRNQMLNDPMYLQSAMQQQQQQLSGQPTYGMGANGSMINSANLLAPNHFNQGNLLPFGQPRPSQ